MYSAIPDIQQEQPVLLYTVKYNGVLYGYYQFNDTTFYYPLKVLKDTFICNEDTVLYLYNGNNLYESDPQLIFDKQIFLKPEKDTTVLVDNQSDNTSENKVVEQVEKPVKEVTTIRHNPDWLIIFLCASLVFVAFLRLFYRKILMANLKSAVDFHLSEKLFNESNSSTKRFSFLLNILFVYNSGILLFYSLNYFNISIPFEIKPIYLLITSIAVIIVAFTGKFLIIKIVGYIFKMQEAMNEYLHNIFIYNKFYGVVILPVILIYPYIDSDISEILLVGSGILYGLLFILQIFRGILIAVKNKLSIFYIILYLCTLEFLPLIIFYKLYDLFIAS